MIPDPAPRRVLVVGAGLAGLRTAAELRAQGFDGEVTVVGAEDALPYDRPPLSKELLTRTEPVWLADDLGADLTSLADRTLLGHRAVGLRADDAGVRLAVAGPTGRSELAADAVVLACGSQAATPAALAGALTLHTADDAARLRARLRPGSRLVCVGAGWIGAEVAGAAAAAGVDVTVLEAAATPLARQLGEEVGALTRAWYDEAGVTLRTSAAATGLSPAGVVLADGTVLAADTFLAATGVRPSTGWLAGALPLTARGALPVGPTGRVTGGPASVRAVGDCADRTSPRDGAVEGGHWDAALTHPAALVSDLLARAGGAEGGAAEGRVADPAPYVFSRQLGHDVTLVGRPTPASEVILRGTPGAGGWTALYVEPGPDGAGAVLRAGFTVDAPRDVGALRKALGGAAYPRIDRTNAADPAVPLRRSLR
ncbi:NAD(P)/FAD-dependent oxidoreductase [Georgenia wangjunii]|uniref:NAD(P)/FAD-dependent oxidoreductase n=1 Tax=Georgenia wangjunii TaxID=3117730 RepID=UPI002F26183C